MSNHFKKIKTAAPQQAGQLRKTPIWNKELWGENRILLINGKHLLKQNQPPVQGAERRWASCSQTKFKPCLLFGALAASQYTQAHKLPFWTSSKWLTHQHTAARRFTEAQVWIVPEFCSSSSFASHKGRSETKNNASMSTSRFLGGG